VQEGLIIGGNISSERALSACEAGCDAPNGGGGGGRSETSVGAGGTGLVSVARGAGKTAGVGGAEIEVISDFELSGCADVTVSGALF